MKKCVVSVLLILTLLTGCVSFSRRLPETGIWYCEELDIYINAENYTGYFRNGNGEYEALFCRIDYGRGIHIHFCESQDADTYLADGTVMNTLYRCDGKTLWLEDQATGIEYEFAEVNKEVYPGG